MRNTIATYKESLSRIASDVLDATEEIELPGSRSRRESPMSERRFSHRFAQSVSPGGSPVPNGVGSGSVTEIDRQKAEIERLQASEAEIKALAINYAAILKEKEGQLSRLHDENDSLRKSLDARNGTSSLSKDENLKVTKNNSVAYKGSTNLSPNRQHRNTMQVSPRPFGNNAQKNTISKQEVFSNGSVQKTSSIPSTESEELETLLEEKNKGLTSLQAKYESEIKQLRMEVEKEHEISSNLKLKYEDEQKLSSSSQKELNDLKSENERISAEMKEMQKKLDMKLSEISRLQVELNRRNNEKELGKSFQDLESTIAILEKDNSKLRIEKETLEAALELNNTEKADADNSESFDKALSNFKKEKEEMMLSIQQLEKSLKDTCKERDKAQRELARLKQHLLDKELEESDKMDEDSKIIEELRAISDHQKDHIAKLEMALKQEITKQEELKNLKSHETHKMSDIINALNQKLANYTNIVESKNIELLNLQTALGQYYAESEAKERLEGELAVLREEMAKQSEVLKIAKQDLEISREEKEETLAKLSQAEKVLSESKRTVQKLQDDNLKLHRALEQSVTRMNRMSMDSDFYVDRRIVIKLLVTYFQRNHSKEVLDLMVRMLGFSEEDKQRIGFAQQAAGRTAVRGVLGLPGRLVGGILGGKTPEASSAVPSENQSFTDLWVDFLLKETEQRERREADGSASSSAEKGVYITGTLSVPGTSVPANAVSTTVQTSAGRYSSPSQKSNHLFEQDSEFATVPLTSSVSPPDETTSRLSRLLQKHRDPTV